MFYEKKVTVEFTVRFDADNDDQAESELQDTISEIRMLDGVTVTSVEFHN